MQVGNGGVSICACDPLIRLARTLSERRASSHYRARK